MIDIQKIRSTKDIAILFIGTYPSIIQSILDFDFLSGKKIPSLVGIIGYGRRNERYFYGRKEILLPVWQSYQHIPQEIASRINVFFNSSSSRRVLTTTTKALDFFPSLLGGVIFAEDVPERHAIALYQKASKLNKFLIGPASVGLLLPGRLKLGAIGGVDAQQIINTKSTTPGTIAVFSSSGGMTNELITLVTKKHTISLALSFGGDRFPITTPKEAFLTAQEDRSTHAIVYFGELGGYDEYEIAKLLKSKKVTKKVICYIAGSISEMFETPPQFGHAKAMAGNLKESALAKRHALQEAGAFVANSFQEFVEMIDALESKTTNAEQKEKYDMIQKDMDNREHALIATSISQDKDGKVMVLGEELLSFAKGNSFAKIVGSLFLGRKLHSKDTEKFINFVLRLLVDHGPYVSGAVNTIITARAGRDLVSSLATGLLTIGPRFGGAINEAAENWLTGVSNEKQATLFVEEFASQKKFISGIGHKKYSTEFPDPRVKEILKFVPGNGKYTKFAKEVEKITTAKKGNLILNVDGAIAAVLLDLLSEKEKLTVDELQRLVEIEFFNALFVLSRSVGFIGHFLDQKRIDEGLFRLPTEEVADVSTK